MRLKTQQQLDELRNKQLLDQQNNTNVTTSSSNSDNNMNDNMNDSDSNMIDSDDELPDFLGDLLDFDDLERDLLDFDDLERDDLPKLDDPERFLPLPYVAFSFSYLQLLSLIRPEQERLFDCLIQCLPSWALDILNVNVYYVKSVLEKTSKA